ncbi:hypothetical protein GGR21_003143 [Dysgonomonas hofstadii]|uniref:SPOR domain-containing protein n=1 Tax=Dysgonomonas hofstadii TaxID=637886 RepID=A0A840CPB1_9BACT|nr:hypothetical protein [Dysgonomonas hofstadii]MBB4037226.1 hypothetical protein [Dysgonomonas hofstadii]
MKISIYTTLLLAFIFIVMPCQSQTGKDKGYKSFYKSLNRHNGDIKLHDQKGIQAPDEIIDVITVAELDSVMKNMTAVTDIMQGGKSLLHPVITLELDRNSSASQALFGCDETLDRAPDYGKGTPEPKIPGIPMVKKTLASASTPAKTNVEVPALATSKPASNSTTPSPTAKPATKPADPAIASAASPKPAATSQFNNTWNLLRSVPVTLADEKDKALLKKYSVVVGTFKSQNNADFVKRTFNGLGERALVVKNGTGLFYTLLEGHDSNAGAIQQLEDFTKKYVEGQSKARRVSRYGISLDDLWILVHE